MSKPIDPNHPLRQGDGAPVKKSLVASIAKPFRYLRWRFFERARANAERELPVGRIIYGEDGNNAEVRVEATTKNAPVVWELGKPETWLHGVHPEDVKLRNLDGNAAGNMTVGVGEDAVTGEPVTSVQFRGNESVIKMPPPEAWGLTQAAVDAAREGFYDGRRGRDAHGFLRDEAKAVPISMAVSAVKRTGASNPTEAAALVKVLEAITGKTAEQVIAEQRLAEAQVRAEAKEEDSEATADIATVAIKDAIQSLQESGPADEQHDLTTDSSGGEG
jgi:hypothetical protein